MRLIVNGQPTEINCDTVGRAFPDKVVISGGYQLDGDYKFKGGEGLVVIEKGKMPPENLLNIMMSSRHSPEVHNAVKQAHVAILGLGGLGSNLGVMLARLGVGTLTIVDYDVVEPSNLNRQSYYVSDIGRPKCDALKEQLGKINPYITVNAVNKRVTEENIIGLIHGADIVCEAFDRAEAKAFAVNKVLECTDKAVVCASGMAGYGKSNEITTRQLGRLVICGDGESDSRIGVGLMSPRVSICAAHQANAVLRLIMGLEP